MLALSLSPLTEYAPSFKFISRICPPITPYLDWIYFLFIFQIFNILSFRSYLILIARIFFLKFCITLMRIFYVILLYTIHQFVMKSFVKLLSNWFFKYFLFEMEGLNYFNFIKNKYFIWFYKIYLNHFLIEWIYGQINIIII